jgi:predicted nuclease with TOPRIM domain
MADVMIQLSGGIEGFAKQYMVDLALARALRPGSKTVLDGMRVIGDMVRRSTEMQIAIEEKQKDRDLAVITQSDLESELKDLLKRMESKKVETPLIEQDLPDEMLDVDMPPDA